MLSASAIDHLRALTSFSHLIDFLRDQLDWPIDLDSAADPDDLVFDYDPAELGIDPKYGAKIESIRQFRPFVTGQQWGIFWVAFEAKRLPVMALRRVLTALVNKRRDADRPAWKQDDLLFITVQGTGADRGIAFSHFSDNDLQTFSWDARENHFFYLKNMHLDRLRWPRDPRDVAAWREAWRAAFTTTYKHTIQSSRALATELARCAITIRELVGDLYEVEADSGALHRLLLTFRLELLNALNPRDFADMIAQTVSYGLFSAAASATTALTLNPSPSGRGTSRENRPSNSPSDRGAWGSSDSPLPEGEGQGVRASGILTIDTLADAIPKTNPFLHDLFGQLTAQDGLSLDELGVSQLIDLLNDTHMADILQDFGRQTGSGREDPVIHFYEEFLSQYDHDKKVDRGVFYTPDPVVEYMVRAVDDLLKSEFGLSDGLASADTHPATGEPLVQILDPATGTGTFLAHIIDHIAATVKARRGVDWNAYVRDSLLPRLNGFELMMAPYTIAHTKLGLKLQQTGYDLSANDQRLRVFLTNALEPGILSGEQLGDTHFLEREAGEAGSVKRSKPIMVVIGNPPYSGTSQNNGAYIAKLIRDYYFVDGQPLGERNPKWLQDDYVKFIRFGQARIAQNGSGILAFITNHGYLDNPTFRGMRQQLMQTFDDIYIVDLHGNSKKKERAPDGGKDENVFDIQQGVAIGIFIKHTGAEGAIKSPAVVRHIHVWGTRETKYTELNTNTVPSDWTVVEPQKPFYLFLPQAAELRNEYSNGWKITDVFGSGDPGYDAGKNYGLGVVTHNDLLFTDFTKTNLRDRISKLADKKIPDQEIINTLPVIEGPYWNTQHERSIIQSTNWEQQIQSLYYRPFDWRYIYYEPDLLEIGRGGASRHVMRHVPKSGLNLLLSKGYEIDVFEHVLVTKDISVHHAATRKEGHYFFPLYIIPPKNQLFDESMWPLSEKGRRPNLSRAFVQAVERALGLSFITDGSGDLDTTFGPEDIFHYAYAVFHSPIYRARYAEFLKIDFPRLPLTIDRDLFGALCSLGNDLVALHLMEDPEALTLNPSPSGRGTSKPARATPDSTRVEGPEVRVSDSPLPKGEGLGVRASGVRAYPQFVRGANGTTVGTMRESDAYDADHGGRVYLDTKLKAKGSYFEGVPPDVWKFRIGGYQVAHKWLYDRRGSNGEPGRTLTDDDIAHYQGIVVALRETIRLMSEIDAVIEDYGGWPLVGSTGESTEDAMGNINWGDQQPELFEDDRQPRLQSAQNDTLDESEDGIESDREVAEAYEASEGGIAFEPTDSQPIDGEMVDPFNPREINIVTTTAVIEGLKRRIENSEIDLQPDFQRQSGIWNNQAQSRLIESLMIRVPIPAFYFDATDEDKWLVIDGLQRLTTIKRFMIETDLAKQLRLTNLEFLIEHNGKSYAELPRALQRRIEESQVTVYIVQRGTPPNVKFNIFKRINTGGLPLSAQEIRHALYQGKSTVLLQELAESQAFRGATWEGVRDERMQAREIVLRFLAFILTRPADYKSPDLDSFLIERMVQINAMSDADIDTLRQRFNIAMIRSERVLDEYAFRKIFAGDRRGPVSKALFETWAVNLEALTDDQINTLTRRRRGLLNEYKRLLADDDFNRAISYATGDIRRVRERFDKIRGIIDKTLADRE